jgi:hypothetical protein
MRSNRRLVRVLTVAMASLVLASPGGSDARGGTRLVGATGAEQRVVAWVLDRYAEARLDLPPLTIAFHATPAGCGGNSGYFLDDRLDVCLAGQTLEYQRNVVMHELAHAWCVAHVAAARRRAFMAARGLRSWNDPSTPWGYRGFEQAAEVITWGIGDREIPPLIPGDPTDHELASAFEILTGERPISP